MPTTLQMLNVTVLSLHGRLLAVITCSYCLMMICRDSNLTDALAAIQLPLPALPAPVTRLLLQHSTSTANLASPTIVRQHIRDLGGAAVTPVTSDMKRVVTLLIYCMADINDGDAGSVCAQRLPPVCENWRHCRRHHRQCLKSFWLATTGRHWAKAGLNSYRRT